MSANKNIIKRVWFKSVAIAIAAVVLVGIIDVRLSNDDPNENARNLSGVKEKARADREYIKVTLPQLRDIVSGVRERHPVDYGDLVMQDVSKNDTIVTINLAGIESAAMEKLIGSNENSQRFKDVYTVGNNFHFRVSVFGGDTMIVDCPAYILAKLIELKEN